MLQTYPVYNPRRAALLKLLAGVDPSERPVSRLNPTEQAGGSSYVGPRFDPRAVSSGRYAGPQLTVSHRNADAQDSAYTGPKLVVNRTEQPADADRVVDDPRQYPVYNPPAAPQQYPTFKAPPDASVTAGPAGDDLYPKVASPGGYTGPKGPVTTQPSASEQDAAHLHDLMTKPVETTGRARGAFEMLGQPVQPSSSLGYVIGERLGNAASGLADKRAVGRIKRQQEIAQAQAQLGVDAAAEKARGEAEGRTAETRLRNTQADYYEQRPWLEEQKRADAASQRERTAVLQNLRLHKGQPLDPNNPQDRALLESAACAGVFVDPEEWNNSAGNNITLTLTDPKDPSKTNTVLFNRVTKDETVVGQKGFQQPVGPDGMTASQRGSLGLRRDEFKATERQRGIQNEFSRLRIAQGDKRITLAQAAQDNRFSQETRKEMADANKLAAQSEALARAAEDLSSKTTYRDPDTGEIKESKKWAAKRDEYLSRAASLRRQFTDNYGYLFAPSDGEAPQMTLDQFRGLFPNAAGSPAVEASRLGITLTDTDQGVRGPASPMPRRGAPGGGRGAARSPAPSGGKTHVSRADARRLYPELRDKPDAEVDAAIRASGFEPIP